MAPPFKKLKNPILRKSVAKVASLRQAAAVGGISVYDLVNGLRLTVGQNPIPGEPIQDRASYYSSKPEWLDRGRVVESMVEAELDPDVMPLNAIHVVDDDADDDPAAPSAAT